MKAIWNGKTIAESDDTVVIEGNHYFPPESVKEEYLKPSETIQFVHGKEQLLIIHWKLMAKRTKMPPGTILNRVQWPKE
jgi:hypothetical protein